MPLVLPASTLQHPRKAPALNWGILGPGWIAAEFGHSLKTLTRSRISAVGSRSFERSEQFAKRYGDSATRVYDSYTQVIEDPAVDVIYVAVPHSGHADLATQAVSAGRQRRQARPG